MLSNFPIIIIDIVQDQTDKKVVPSQDFIESKSDYDRQRMDLNAFSSKYGAPHSDMFDWKGDYIQIAETERLRLYITQKLHLVIPYAERDCNLFTIVPSDIRALIDDYYFEATDR